MKLTVAQKETLSLVNNGEVHRSNHGYSAWRIDGASPQVVGRLLSLGLIVEGLRCETNGNYKFNLTPAGRAALAQGGGSGT